MADSPSELQFEIEKLERKHAEHPEGRFFVPLANAYRKMGDIETAEALLRSGVERHPDYLSAHIVLGRCLADRDAVREAEVEFRFVLSQDPQNLIALRTLGELALADGRRAEAAEWYRELLAVDPMNDDARQALDSLSDAPASPAEETEFRSGAGWWEPGSDTPEDAPGSTGVEGEPAGEPGDAAEHTSAGASDEESGWPGYDDLPGLRADAANESRQEDAWDGRVDGSAESTPEGEDRYAAPSFEEEGLDLEPVSGFEPEPEREAAPPAEPSSFGAADDTTPQPFAPGFAGGAEPADQPQTTPADEAYAPAFATDDDFDDQGGPDAGAAFPQEGSSEVVTETIAELYARQGLHERAVVVYRELIRRRGGDAVLESRLAEIERLAREGEEAAPDLAFEDEEALLSPRLDADEDPFASSFAAGFTTLEEEAPQPGIGSFDEEALGAASASAEGEAPVDDSDAAAAGQADDEAETVPEQTDVGDGSSIVQFLGALASWRAPAGAASPTPAVQESDDFAEAAGDQPAPLDEGGLETGTGDLHLPAAATEEPTEEPTEDAWANPWAQTTEPPVDLESEPWGIVADTDDGDVSADLPYLDQGLDSPAAGGTGPAEEEPFPWELPGAIPPADAGESGEIAPSAQDRFFVDEVEAKAAESGESMPEAAAPSGSWQQPEPESKPAAAEDPSEDEDLESFQAWLRSLKR